MEHVKVTDEWLYKCMPVVDATIIQELEKQTDINYEFSRKFERKMKRLIKKEAHPWLGAFYTMSKRVAIFLVCLISAALVVTMSVEAYRNKFFDTIKTFLGDAYELRYETDEAPDQIEEYKEPTYIPEGYQEIERDVNENAIMITYENEEHSLIVWDQFLIADAGFMVIDAECDFEITEVVNGVNVTFYLYNNGYAMAYFEDKYYVYCITADDSNAQELTKMIESIEFWFGDGSDVKK